MIGLSHDLKIKQSKFCCNFLVELGTLNGGTSVSSINWSRWFPDTVSYRLHNKRKLVMCSQFVLHLSQCRWKFIKNNDCQSNDNFNIIYSRPTTEHPVWFLQHVLFRVSILFILINNNSSFMFEKCLTLPAVRIRSFKNSIYLL